MSFRQKMRTMRRKDSQSVSFSHNADFSIWITVFLILGLAALLALSGCSRQHYRMKTDKEVYSLLETGGSRDCRWQLDDYRIEVDPRSRMFNRFNPDGEPMPPDDASAHVKMHRVDGKKGSKHWHDNGNTKDVENPAWRQYLLYNDKGAVPLSINGAVELALLHSPEYQSALEGLYLSAANVSQERFNFDVQFFGKESLFYTASGGLRHGNTSILQNDIELEAAKLFATGGELVVGLANTVTWSFSGPDSWSAETLFKLNLMQPLIRNAGRKVVLEKLTKSERDFLAAIRQTVFFQQGFYTKIVTGSGSQSSPSKPSDLISTGVPDFTGGYHDLLMRQIRIRNLRQNIIALEENLHRFQALIESNQIDDVYQVENVRQNVLSNESDLLVQITGYQNSVETFLRSLGLPPDLKVEIEDPLIDQFQLSSTTITALQEDVASLFDKVRKIDEPLPDDFTENLAELIRRTESEITILENDVEALEKQVPQRSAGLKVLEEHLAEFIQQGDRIEAEVYSSEEFLKRVHKLRDVEIPKNLRKLEATFLLLRLIIDHDEATLLEMIEKNDFSDEVRKAKELLQIDSASIDLEGVIDQLEEIEKGREIRDSLLNILKEERKVPANGQKLLVPKPPQPTGNDPFLQRDENVATAETPATESETVDDEKRREAKQIIAQLKQHQEDTYRDWVRKVLTEFQNEVAALSISQIRVRLDTITLVPTRISPEDAFRIAEENRLDWMNQRASLVDTWRQIDITANQLKSDLNVTVEGEYGRIDRSGVNMDGDTGRIRVGFEWDTPLNRHKEMHAYRKAQINYQAARRRYYSYVDSVQAELRNILRDIRLQQVDFEIRRHMILIAAVKVDAAQLELIKPAERGKPIDTNTSDRLISSLGSMSSTQNQFIASWLDYQNLRMMLDLNMGTMELDAQGRWVDPGRITKDRTGPVARFGGRNAVPGLAPSHRAVSNRKAGKKHRMKQFVATPAGQLDTAPPPAPRLDDEGPKELILAPTLLEPQPRLDIEKEFKELQPAPVPPLPVQPAPRKEPEPAAPETPPEPAILPPLPKLTQMRSVEPKRAQPLRPAPPPPMTPE